MGSLYKPYPFISILLPSPDSIDTKSALKHIKELVGGCNVYLSDCKKAERPANVLLLKNIAAYVTKMLRVRFNIAF